MPKPLRTATELKSALAREWERACERVRGFTLVELLVVILIIAILAAAAVAAFLAEQDKAHDSSAQQTVTQAYKAAYSEYTSNNAAYPAVGVLVTKMSQGEPGMTFQDYNGGAGESTGEKNVSVDREGVNSVSLCAKSESERVYCLRSNERGSLIAATDLSEPPSGGILASLRSPLGLIFPDEADAQTWKSNNRKISRCVGATEAAARACLATTTQAAQESDQANIGWGGSPEPADESQPLTQPSDTELTSIAQFTYRAWASRPTFAYTAGCDADCQALWSAEQSLDPSSSEASYETFQSLLKFLGASNNSVGSPCRWGNSNVGRFDLQTSASQATVRINTPAAGYTDKLVTVNLPVAHVKPGGVDDRGFRMQCSSSASVGTQGGYIPGPAWVFNYIGTGGNYSGINYYSDACQYTYPPTDPRMQVFNGTTTTWCHNPAPVSVYYLDEYDLDYASPIRDYSPGDPYDYQISALNDSTPSQTKTRAQAALASGNYDLALAWLQYHLGNYGSNPAAG